jgi:hypothetical protein
MGNCCDGMKNDYDIINIQFEKDKNKKSSTLEFQSQTDHNTGINNIQQTNMNKNNDSPSNLYISRKKLKLIIKQSKCLMEGKEIIINSLGLLNSKNNYNDGLTIFGDSNVINK